MYVSPVQDGENRTDLLLRNKKCSCLQQGSPENPIHICCQPGEMCNPQRQSYQTRNCMDHQRNFNRRTRQLEDYWQSNSNQEPWDYQSSYQEYHEQIPEHCYPQYCNGDNFQNHLRRDESLLFNNGCTYRHDIHDFDRCSNENVFQGGFRNDPYSADHDNFQYFVHRDFLEDFRPDHNAPHCERWDEYWDGSWPTKPVGFGLPIDLNYGGYYPKWELETAAFVLRENLYREIPTLERLRHFLGMPSTLGPYWIPSPPLVNENHWHKPPTCHSYLIKPEQITITNRRNRKGLQHTNIRRMF